MQRPFWRRHLWRLKKHVAWTALAVGGLAAVRTFVPQPVLAGAAGVGGNFLQTFGSMYGIIVAFAIYVTWQQHNDTQVAIEREAVSLGELHRVLRWFEGWVTRDAVRATLLAYARTVPRRYSERPPEEIVDEKGLLDAGLEAFLSHAPANPREERLYEPTLALFHELNEAREHRVTVAGLRLPEGLRWFVYLGGGISVVSLWLLWVDSLPVHALFTAAMTWVVVAAASIVIDLDLPYSGDFVVNWARFDEAAHRMAADGAGLPPAEAAAPERSPE